MRPWPVPDSFDRILPCNGSPGSFWEHRGDRHHCGVDIYAPRGSQVISIEGGRVLETGVFTSPEMIGYWNATYYALVQTPDGLICKYAELGDVVLEPGASIANGQLVGHVGSVLNLARIGPAAPEYVRRLKDANCGSMLHLELYSRLPALPERYLGGNTFVPTRPAHLLDAGRYLNHKED